VAELKAMAGGDILVAGSAMLVQSLIEFQLVDEWRLMVFPIILGEGKRLFSGGQLSFKLQEAKPVGNQGVLTLVYHPK
jgi:dihydrofolate reductase